MNLAESLKYIDSLIQKGYRFEFETVNQIWNGNKNEDGTPKNGAPEMPLFTITSYVYEPYDRNLPDDSTVNCDPIEKYFVSFNTLEEMYTYLAFHMKKDKFGK